MRSLSFSWDKGLYVDRPFEVQKIDMKEVFSFIVKYEISHT